MGVPLLLGVVGGVGLVLLAGALVPARGDLAAELEWLRRRRPVASPPTTGAGRGPALRLARALGLERRLGGGVEADLRVTGGSLEAHLARRVLFGAWGLCFGPLVGVMCWAAGLPTPMVVPAGVSLAVGAVGLLAPGPSLRSEAATRRRSFRHAFGAFLDVVAMSLAGGRGVEAALSAAARSGRGWAFTEIRHALDGARLRRETPWAGLERLGADLGVPEVAELAASVALAGGEGARVRASIVAKARALRTRELAEAEAAAQAATEHMSLPTVALLVGYIVFLLYPALMRVMAGL